jgi:hypothetical protein
LKEKLLKMCTLFQSQLDVILKKLREKYGTTTISIGELEEFLLQISRA